MTKNNTTYFTDLTSFLPLAELYHIQSASANLNQKIPYCIIRQKDFYYSALFFFFIQALKLFLTSFFGQKQQGICSFQIHVLLFLINFFIKLCIFSIFSIFVIANSFFVKFSFFDKFLLPYYFSCTKI